MRAHRVALFVGLLSLSCAPDPGFDDSTRAPEWPLDPQGTGAPNTQPGDLPCEVAELLQQRCISCHSDPPTGGAPIPMVSRAQLVAASYVDPGQSVAERAVVRMRDTRSPMPPGAAPSLPEAEIEVLTSWIASGMPAGSCAAPGSKPDPEFDVPAQCSSKRFEPRWTDDSDDEESEFMQPGRACIACHRVEEGKDLVEVGGTVYPTAHEPDLCVSPSAEGAIVEITDARKTVHRLRVNRMGNFALLKDDDDDPNRIARPYTVRLLHDGRVREMKTPQTSGDCNGCHTQNGTNGAPGRILLP